MMLIVVEIGMAGKYHLKFQDHVDISTTSNRF